jgi:hypothetical protein
MYENTQHLNLTAVTAAGGLTANGHFVTTLRFSMADSDCTRITVLQFDSKPRTAFIFSIFNFLLPWIISKPVSQTRSLLHITLSVIICLPTFSPKQFATALLQTAAPPRL